MRKLSKELIFQILSQRFEDGFLKLSHLPHPSTFKDMQKASRRIVQAIHNKERITIVGDYDVDGVVSSALMQEFFDTLHYPVDIVIPNRFKDGYGLSEKLLDRVDADLIVTVDNGINATKAAKLCKERGIDLIITDHHTPPKELPDAYAIVNPKQRACGFSYSEICGAQVAWFLIAQLKSDLGMQLDMGSFLDLLSIAIIADVMPLRHINRPLVQKGLQLFTHSKRPSISFLRTNLKKERFGTDDIGFGIAPVLNSAGRMEDASLALEFLMAKDVFEASVYYSRLLALNAKRKAEERRAYKESLQFVDENQKVIVSVGENWNEGVVGIVASRLTERFQRPSIVLTKNEKGYYKGSGRSLGEVDLFALLDGASEHLLQFGGHKKAAGLSLEKESIAPFRTHINALASTLPPEAFLEEDGVLGELDFDQIDWELIDIIDSFAPYGESNPLPKFASFDIEVLESREVGENAEHLLLTLRQKGRIFRAIHFRKEKPLTKDRIDIVYYPAKNSFRNQTSIQLFVTKIV